MAQERDLGSFRDPAGHIFRRDGAIFRQVNREYADTWDRLVASGLLDDLAADGRLIPHEVVDSALGAGDVHAVIMPEVVPVITYPYEWCFSQLQDAALLTLGVMKGALDRGFWLRDASAFNVQLLGSRPVFIDTLSFGEYREGEPWGAYGQFCRHFLAPLALASRVHPEFLKGLRTHLDGIPLDVAARALPRSTLVQGGLLTHLHLHALAVGKGGGGSGGRKFPKTALLGLLDSLERTVSGLKPPKGRSAWGDYYANTNYSDTAFGAKAEIVRGMLLQIAPTPRTVWDLGANTGAFSEIAAETADSVVAWDLDPNAVEGAYRKWRGEGRANLLPLVQDFSNPSPAVGWAHAERMSLAERGPADALLALALVHHLAIGNNVPLPEVARWMASLGEWAIVEFVPKEDSQVQRMLASRDDVFPGYSLGGFRAAFSREFEQVAESSVAESLRTLHLFRRRGR